ncbi:MAG: rRNA maturation RNase YbeY [Azoarcus sp.]|jgi:probable rRNA maturation factor|nr:rRNA maturation RNase YbeY [Azoarcus sp.]
MAKQTNKPKVVITDGKGKKSRLAAEQIDLDFGEGRRLRFLFPETGGNDLEIEAVAANDESVPILNMQPCACNVVCLRVEGASKDDFVEDEELSEAAEPVLSLLVQKAVEGADRDNTPKKYQVRRWAQAALLQRSVEVTVRLVGEAEGRALNKNYRGKDCATNVLTFTYGGRKEGKDAKSAIPEQDDECDALIGDIVLCVPVLAREAGEQGKALDAHFAHLVVHGMLHLQGFDHKKKAEAEAMEAREREILNALGYADPYVV